MKVSNLIKTYSQMGIRLWSDNEKNLHYSAVPGIMNDKIKAEMKKYKTELLEWLDQAKIKEIQHDEKTRYNKFPLTDIQSSYLVGMTNAYEYGGTDCHIYLEIPLKNMKYNQLLVAWKSIVSRHDMLRTIIRSDGYQQVYKHLDYSPNILRYNVDKRENFQDIVIKVRNDMSKRIFQANQWPMFELAITEQKEEAMLHFSISMLIADSISIGIILRELLECYQGNTLSQLDITYRDVVMYNEKRKNDPDITQKYDIDKKYWLSKITQMPLPPKLPKNNISNTSEDIEFLHKRTVINQAIWDDVKEYAKQNQLTETCVLLTLYTDVLALWSKNQDFSISLTKMERNKSNDQVDKIVGDFTSIEILSVYKNDGNSFIERARNIQKRLWEDLEHGTYTGIEVLRELSKVQGTNVIIPYVFTSTLGINNLHNDNIDIFYRASQTPQVFVDCQIRACKDGLEICWDIRKNVFVADIAEQLFETYIEMIYGLSENKTLWNKPQYLDIPSKMREIRRIVNNTKIHYNHKSLIDDFLKNVKKAPQNTAVIFMDHSYSYQKLYDEAYRYKIALEKRTFCNGDLVGIIMKKSFEQIAAILGTLLAGGVYVPIYREQPKNRMDKILEQARIRYVIVDNDFQETFKNQELTILTVSMLSEIINIEVPDEKNIDYNKPAYIIFTSGSTGTPKGVIISHKSAMNTIDDINHRFHVTSKDMAIGISNISFDLSVYDIFGMLSAGGCLLIPTEKQNIDEIGMLIKKYPVTIWNTVPALMQQLISYLNTFNKKEDFYLRIALLSGDWIPVELYNKLKNLINDIRVISLGGATEASIWSIYHEIQEEDTTYKSIPYGKPLANQTFHVYNSRLHKVPDWTEGELYIGGTGLAEAYLNEPELTKNKFLIHPVTKERIYKTGDIGRYRPDGVIEFLGREDSQVKIHGNRIELNEIEAVMQQNKLIENAAVIVKGYIPQEYQLHGFAVPAHKGKKEIYKEEAENLQSKLLKFTNMLTKDIDEEQFQYYMKSAEDMALLQILEFLRENGIFNIPYKVYNYPEICKKINARPEYFKLIKRWLNALYTAGYIDCINQENLSYCGKNISINKKLEQAQKVLESDYIEKMGCKISQSYFEESVKNIKLVIDGTKKAQEILFPKASTETAFRVYHDNIFSEIMNHTIVQGILYIVDRSLKNHPEHTLRILEIGAGTGGTSDEILPHLNGKNVEYYFTDVSTFFLNKAKEKYAKYPWIHYKIFDINKDYKLQNINAGSMDIILCANVLHVAVNGYEAFDTLKAITVPNGYLCIIDAIKELNSLLTSMGFLYRVDATDERSEKEEIFFQLNHWYRNFKYGQAELLFEYPKPNHFLSCCHQKVFIARFNEDRITVSDSDVKKYLKDRLPYYMIPKEISMLLELPKTDNGKIDKKRLKKIAEIQNHTVLSKENIPQGKLEQGIVNIWQKVLNLEKPIGRHDNFFEIGGDSLLLAQTVGEMKNSIKETKNIEWETLMRLMLQNNTIYKFATAIADFKHTSSNDFVFMTELNDSYTSNNTVVLFSDGTGRLTIYNDLLELMKQKNTQKRIIGFSFTDYEKYTILQDKMAIQTIALQCANKLESMNLTGLLELTGHCFGGAIALETARILKQRGIKQVKVILIDSKKFVSQIYSKLLFERGFAFIVGANLTSCGHSISTDILYKVIKDYGVSITDDQLLEGLNNILGEKNPYIDLIHLTENERLNKIYDTLKNNTLPLVDNFSKAEFCKLYNIFQKSVNSFIEYSPENYIGDVYSFECNRTNKIILLDSPKNQDYITYKYILGNITKHSLHGNHITCMKKQNVLPVAKLLNTPDRKEN